jgi:hypothetical protein
VLMESNKLPINVYAISGGKATWYTLVNRDCDG